MSPDNTHSVRHILSLSGGKDSAALAVYMRDRIPDIEYVFCDTGEEMPETYEYIDRLEVLLGKPVVRLNPDRPFTHYLDIYRGVLPDARTRWCTRMLKIRPFEKYVGDDLVINYIGLRADENRVGYISHKPNIQARYPFIEDKIYKEDVFRILEESGLGLPAYYKWRSRSGCYFCFFQQRIEWVGLLENHPDLFKKAMACEKEGATARERFTWIQRESLRELSAPERVAAIKKEHAKRQECNTKWCAHTSLMDVWSEYDSEPSACLICSL